MMLSSDESGQTRLESDESGQQTCWEQAADGASKQQEWDPYSVTATIDHDIDDLINQQSTKNGLK